MFALLLLAACAPCDDPPTFTDGQAVVQGQQVAIDNDGDGYATSVDCDDRDPDVGPRELYWHDYDRDGYGSTPTLRCPNWLEDDPTADGLLVTNGDDCDDTDRLTYPGAPELCDLVDNDCDGLPDDYDADDLDLDDADPYWLDLDGDGYGRPYAVIYRCDHPYGYADNDGDDNDDEHVLASCSA